MNSDAPRKSRLTSKLRLPFLLILFLGFTTYTLFAVSKQEQQKTAALFGNNNNNKTKNPVNWNFTYQSVGSNEFVLNFIADIEDQWFIYSKDTDPKPAVPTKVIFNNSNNFELVGAVQESGTRIDYFDKDIEKDIKKYSNKLKITQRVRTHQPTQTISGNVEFMACNDRECLPPKLKPFTFELQQKIADEDYADFLPTSNSTSFKNSSSKINTTAASKKSALDQEYGLSQRKNVVNRERVEDIEKTNDLVAANMPSFFASKLNKTATKQKADKEVKEIEAKTNTTNDGSGVAGTDSQTTKKQDESEEETAQTATELPSNPVTWSFHLQPVAVNAGIYEIQITGQLYKGWSVYAPNINTATENNYPLQVQLAASPNFQLIDAQPVSIDNEVNANGTLLSGDLITLKQRVKILANEPFNGVLSYAATNGEETLNNQTQDFVLNEFELVILPSETSTAGWWWVIGAGVAFSILMAYASNRLKPAVNSNHATKTNEQTGKHKNIA